MFDWNCCGFCFLLFWILCGRHFNSHCLFFVGWRFTVWGSWACSIYPRSAFAASGGKHYVLIQSLWRMCLLPFCEFLVGWIDNQMKVFNFWLFFGYFDWYAFSLICFVLLAMILVSLALPPPFFYLSLLPPPKWRKSTDSCYLVLNISMSQLSVLILLSITVFRFVYFYWYFLWKTDIMNLSKMA